MSQCPRQRDQLIHRRYIKSRLQ